MKLIFLSLTWITGIYLGSLCSPPFYIFPITIIILLTIILFWHKRSLILWGGLGLIILLGSIGCYQWRTSEPTLISYLASLKEQKTVEIKGAVSGDPENEDGFSRLSLSIKMIKNDNEWKEVSGKVLVYARSFPIYSQGESLEVEGELQSLSQIDNPSYKTYLADQGFCAIMYYPQIKHIESAWLFSLRNRLAESLESTLPEPQCSLSKALLLGIRSDIPDTLSESFRYSGTSHILAISGLHIAILAGIVISATAWLFGRHRPTYILIAFTLIWIYAFLSGMRPPAFRAAIMFSLFLTALWLGRPRSAIPSLVFTAAIMAGLNPRILWDVSFKLSFASVIGIVLLYPYFHYLKRNAVGNNKAFIASIMNLIMDSLAITVAVIIATLPLLIYYFGYVSFMSIPATLFILLALPGAIILTLLTAIFGLFAPTLSWVLSWIDWLFLSYIAKIAEVFGGFSFAKQELTISGMMVCAYYGVILAVLWRKRLITAIYNTREFTRKL